MVNLIFSGIVAPSGNMYFVIFRMNVVFLLKK